QGETIRLALLSAHYRQPLEFSHDLLDDSRKTLDRWYRALDRAPQQNATAPSAEFIAALKDDLNTPRALAEMHRLSNDINKAEGDEAANLIGQFKACADLIGLLSHASHLWFQGDQDDAV